MLVHGGPGIADYLEPVAAMIEDAALVHRYDQRGSGRSDVTGPYSIGRFVADLDALRAHFGHEQWTLVGHSWGANLALHYAQRHPERTAALVYACGTGLEWGRFSAEHTRRQEARLAPDDVARLRELHALRERTPEEQREHNFLYTIPDFADRARAAEWAADVVRAYDRFPPSLEVNRAINRELHSIPPEAQIAALAALDAPVTIVDCLEDPRPVASCDSLAAALPNGRRLRSTPGTSPGSSSRSVLVRCCAKRSAAEHVEQDALRRRCLVGDLVRGEHLVGGRRRARLVARVDLRQVVSASTVSPRFAKQSTPTAWSIGSAFVRRPAPSSSAATPTASAPRRVTTPSRGAATSRTTGARSSAVVGRPALRPDPAPRRWRRPASTASRRAVSPSARSIPRSE